MSHSKKQYWLVELDPDVDEKDLHGIVIKLPADKSTKTEVGSLVVESERLNQASTKIFASESGKNEPVAGVITVGKQIV